MKIPKANMIFGYPRSGNNWLRYIIEYNTSYSTSGVSLDTQNRKPLYLKFDCIDSSNKSEEHWFVHDHWLKDYGKDKLIFTLRNYKESVVRHILETDKQCSPAKFEQIEQSLREMYMLQLQQYHDYTGPKLLVHYEDTINLDALPKVVDEVTDFLHVWGDDILKKERFLGDIQFHIDNSRGFYRNVGNPASTSDAKSIVWHRNKLTEEQSNRMDEIVKEYPVLFNTYLKQYA